jgi:hypothetical protein
MTTLHHLRIVILTFLYMLQFPCHSPCNINMHYPLPIVIHHSIRQKWGWDNVIAALERNDRVCQITLKLNLQWEKVLDAASQAIISVLTGPTTPPMGPPSTVYSYIIKTLTQALYVVIITRAISYTKKVIIFKESKSCRKRDFSWPWGGSLLLRLQKPE